MIRRSSYKVVRDLNICLLETSSNESFSNKHGFELCVSSISKPTLSLDPAQREKGVAHCLSHSTGKETVGKKPKLTPLLMCLLFASVSPVLWKAVIPAVGFCCTQGSEVPSPATAALGRTELESVFMSEMLPEAREFTSDSELPQSLRTCRSSSQPPSQIHIQCNLDPVPASPFCGKSLNSGLN